MNISELNIPSRGYDHILNNVFQDLPNHGIVEGVDIKSSFILILRFLLVYPEELSWRGKRKPGKLLLRCLL